MTYGINTLTTFDPTKHPEEKKVIIDYKGAGKMNLSVDLAGWNVNEKLIQINK